MLFICLLGIVEAFQRAPSGLYPQEITLRVNHYRQRCQGEATMNCFLVQTGKQIGTDKWELFYDPIKGFHYEQGYIYTLSIRIEKILNPPMDGADRRYILLKVISKEKVR